MSAPGRAADGWRERTRRVIFEAETPAGKAFDIALLVVIALSVLLVMAESVADIRERHGATIIAAEWVVTGLFVVEYVLRLLTAVNPRRYARSFFGVIDLLAILPPLLALVFPGARSLLLVRSLRLLRSFRVLRMAQWLADANYLLEAVRASTRKVLVFLATVLLINVVFGSAMYVVEGPENGYDNMFLGVYWSIVTMSTVGFGDIAPATPVGRVLASALMIIGYGVIAVPTGIVTSQLSRSETRQGLRYAAERGDQAQGEGEGVTEPSENDGGDRPSAGECRRCGAGDPAPGARFCRRCGERLDR